MFYHAFAEQLHRRNATMWSNIGKTHQETIAEIQKLIAEQERIIAKAREDKNRISEAIRKNEEKQEALKKKLKETQMDLGNEDSLEKIFKELKALKKEKEELVGQKNRSIRDEVRANGKKNHLNTKLNKYQNAMRDMPQKEAQANKMAEAYAQKAKMKHPYAKVSIRKLRSLELAK